jgi:hypothetical protein
MNESIKKAVKELCKDCSVKNCAIENKSNCRDIAKYIKGYEQAEKDFLKKTCDWLKKNLTFHDDSKDKDVCIVNLGHFIDSMKGDN